MSYIKIVYQKEIFPKQFGTLKSICKFCLSLLLIPEPSQHTDLPLIGYWCGKLLLHLSSQVNWVGPRVARALKDSCLCPQESCLFASVYYANILTACVHHNALPYITTRCYQNNNIKGENDLLTILHGSKISSHS